MPLRALAKISISVTLVLSAYGVLMFGSVHLPSPFHLLAAVALTLFFLGAAVFLLDMTVPGFHFLSFALCRLPGQPQNTVALTFDDGPVEPYTREILDVLDRFDVKANFFCSGRNVERFPDLAREIVKRGHTIGNHTYHHRLLPFVSKAECEREIANGAEAIAKVTGKQTRLVRVPKGYKSRGVARAVSKLGAHLIGFSYPIFDVENPHPQVLVDRVLSRVAPGDIILMHDGFSPRTPGTRDSLVTALPIILKGLREKGLRPVSLDHALSSGTKDGR